MTRNTTSERNQRPSLGEVLFNSSHRLLLDLFLRSPEDSFHLREIARRTGISPGALHRELKHFADAGLLRRTEVGQQVHYQVNDRYPGLVEFSEAFRQILSPQSPLGEVAESPAPYSVDRARVRRRTRAPLDRLNVKKKMLSALCRRHHVSKLSFFGSITRDDFKPASDIDVLVEFQPEHSTTLSDLVGLRDDLSKLFGGRRVDVATPAILRNPYRRAAIEKDLQTAYAAR